jgi:hypothetical protein
MTDREILEKAIQQAIAGGFVTNLKVYPYDVYENFVTVHYLDEDVDMHIYEIIYSHDFAKALWGDGWAWFTEGQSGDTLPSGNYINYKGHLANMAVADDPIKYLEKNI